MTEPFTVMPVASQKEQELAQRGIRHIVVPGEPVPQGRPRFRIQGAFVKAYDPPKSASYKELIKWYTRTFLRRHPDLPELTENICAKIEVFRSIPESFSKKKKEAAENGLLLPNTKPDTDNYVKTVLDALNGLLFKDDSAVVQITAVKRYSANPRIEISFWAIDPATGGAL